MNRFEDEHFEATEQDVMDSLNDDIGELTAQLAAERTACEKAERERDEVLALVREWLCEKCNTVFPGPPQPGASCLICPKCGGTTTPRPLAEKRIAERERDEALELCQREVAKANKTTTAALLMGAQTNEALKEARKALVWIVDHWPGPIVGGKICALLGRARWPDEHMAAVRAARGGAEDE